MRSIMAVLFFAPIVVAVGIVAIFARNHIALGQVAQKTSPKTAAAKAPAKGDAKADKDGPGKQPEKAAVEEKFDQKKADIETIKAANMPFEAKALIEFFRKHTVSDVARTKLTELIRQLGDDDFDRREDASTQIETFGVSAIGMLRQAERTSDPEVLRRCEICLKNIEKVPTRTLAGAAARLLAELKPEGATETLLNYLPLAEDESVADDIRGAIASLAMNDGVPDAYLRKTLESKDAVKRGAAAEAFARNGDKKIRAEMRQMMLKENDIDSKMRIAVALVTFAKDKLVVEDMIKLMAEVPPAAGWRAEEILIRLADEKGPAVSLGSDRASREKARDEWLKWWKNNEKTISLAKLDETEPMLGYTLIVEMDQRQQGGRVKEVTPDGKVRWEITNVQGPTDAIVLPGNRVVVAEQNIQRVSERDTTNGKEIWGVPFNQPIGLHRLGNGNIVVVGRQQMIEWDRERKPVTIVNRPQNDIVAGAKLRNGNFAAYTQAGRQGQIYVFDKNGKELDHFPVGRPNYISSMQALPNGKILITQLIGIAEVDFAAKKAEVVLNFNSAASAQKLPNGNILLSSQNGQVVEMEPKANKNIWEYKPDNNNAFYRPWRAKRR